MSEGKGSARGLRAWAPVVAYMGVIFWLSGQTTLPQPPGLFSWDKFQHFGAYALMGLLIYRASRMRPILGSGPYSGALILGALYGASDEFHQHFVPGRNMSIVDWLADVIGIVLALGVVWAIRRKVSE